MVRSFILSLVLLCGCAVRQPLPVLSGAAVIGDQLVEFERDTAQRTEEVRSYRALNRMIIFHGKEQNSYRQVVLFAEPSKLRIETLPLGASYTLNLLTVRNDQIVYLDAQNKRALLGVNSIAALSEILPLPLDARDLAALLIGTLPPSVMEQSQKPAVHLVDERQRAQILSSNHSQYYELNLLDSTVRLAEFRDGRKLVARVTLDDFTLVSEIPIPGKVTIDLINDKVKIEILMVKAEVNPQLAENLFMAKIPADFKRETL